MITLQEINESIIVKGKQLASNTKDAIVNITIHSSTTVSEPHSQDVPSRPWMLTGTACITASIIGAMSCDSETKWPYMIGALGLISLGIGFTKRKSSNSTNDKKNYSNVNIDEEKAFIIEKSNNILDSTKKEWDSFMDSIKNDVQSIIKESNIPNEKKDEYLSLTYYPETLPLSTLSLLDKFDTINNMSDVASQLLVKKSDFANEVALKIINTANSQIKTYSKIRLL